MSIHQAPLLHRTAERPDYEVTMVCEKDVGSERKARGWTIPDFGSAKVYIDPEKSIVSKLLDYPLTSTIHFVTGFRAYPMMNKVLMTCIENDLQVGVMAEVPNHYYGIKGVIKTLAYGIQAIRIRNSLDFVLAIGADGVEWYGRCGYPESMLFPFGYVIDEMDDRITINEEQKCCRLIFVGGLIKRKCVNQFLKALATLNTDEWILDIIGDGEEREHLYRSADELGTISKVSFLGSISNNLAKDHIARSDLLVLPSREDGWGAVVSEALMAGTPVICSDRCGASALLGLDELGTVFRAESIEDLSEVLSNRISKGRVRKDRRNFIR